MESRCRIWKHYAAGGRGAHLAGLLPAAVALNHIPGAVDLRQALPPSPARRAFLDDGTGAGRVPLPISLRYTGSSRLLLPLLLPLVLPLLPLLKVFHGLQEQGILLMLLMPCVLLCLARLPRHALPRHLLHLLHRLPCQIFNVPCRGLLRAARWGCCRCQPRSAAPLLPLLWQQRLPLPPGIRLLPLVPTLAVP